MQNSTNLGSIGINVENTDQADNATFTPVIGIKSLVSNPFPNQNCFKVAGWFEATPTINCSGTVDQISVYVPPQGGIVSLGYALAAGSPPFLFNDLLEVNGDIGVTGFYNTISDQSLKQNINIIDDPLEKVSSLNGVYFHWDTLGNPLYDFNSSRQVGLIAQNVDTVLPEVVKGNPGLLTVDYGHITPLLVEAIKALSAKVENLEDIVGDCCEQNIFKTTGSNEGGGEINEPIREKLISKGVILYDAVPNPFQNEVSIGFFIPERIITAEIVFHDNFGRTLKTVEVNQRGNGSIIIDATDLATGLYTYGIIADGQAIDTKKMVRAK